MHVISQLGCMYVCMYDYCVNHYIDAFPVHYNKRHRLKNENGHIQRVVYNNYIKPTIPAGSTHRKLTQLPENDEDINYVGKYPKFKMIS